MYMYFVDGIFTVGNECIERTINFFENMPIYSSVRNTQTDYIFKTRNNTAIMFIPEFDYKNAEISIVENGLLFKSNFEIMWNFKVYENLPIIESKISIKGNPINTKNSLLQETTSGIETDRVKSVIELPTFSVCDTVGTASKFTKIHYVNLFDITDKCDNLIRETDEFMYVNQNCEYDGQIFTINDYTESNSLLVVKNSPTTVGQLDRIKHDLCVNQTSCMNIPLCGINLSEINNNEFTDAYSISIGVCKSGSECDLFKKYYSENYIPKESYIMSNTWGDRNRDKVLCESFILNEIEMAKKIGVDVVQIDDGWQLGTTANSAFSNNSAWGEGYRKQNPNFWSVDLRKFPNGLNNIVEFAESCGVKIGLWFSPDGHEDFANYKDDIDVLYSLYVNYGIKYFKLDGITVKNKLCEKRLLCFLQTLSKLSNDEICFNMDITAGKRFGYLFANQFGNLFVENRYTDWGNYFPHNTLRNLWQLSKWIPTEKLQFEVLNLRRNKNKYNGILSPDNYSIDYVFASVMVSNPLIWLEMTNLSDDDIERLTQIISVYKKYRNDYKEISQYGSCPDGFTNTGFIICGNGNKYGIFIRENSENSTFEIPIKEVLYTNDDNFELTENGFILSNKRTFLFARI